MKSSLNINQDEKLNMTLYHSFKIFHGSSQNRIKILHFKEKSLKGFFILFASILAQIIHFFLVFKMRRRNERNQINHSNKTFERNQREMAVKFANRKKKVTDFEF